jgi:hypothetical protein
VTKAHIQPEAKFCYLLLVSTKNKIKDLNGEFPRTYLSDDIDALINTLK